MEVRKMSDARDAGQDDGAGWRRRRQALSTLGIIAVVSGLTIFIFHEDASYFLVKSAPSDLGTAPEIAKDLLTDNTYVKAAGIADPRIQFAESNGKTYRYFILLGTRILVEQRVQGPSVAKDIRAFNYAGQGRLLKLSNLVRYEMLMKHFKENLRLDLSEDGYLLRDGVAPSDSLYPFLLVCCALAATILSVLWYFIVARARKKG
jgi:hypothetical protein